MDRGRPEHPEPWKGGRSWSSPAEQRLEALFGREGDLGSEGQRPRGDTFSLATKLADVRPMSKKKDCPESPELGRFESLYARGFRRRIHALAALLDK